MLSRLKPRTLPLSLPTLRLLLRTSSTIYFLVTVPLRIAYFRSFTITMSFSSDDDDDNNKKISNDDHDRLYIYVILDAIFTLVCMVEIKLGYKSSKHGLLHFFKTHKIVVPHNPLNSSRFERSTYDHGASSGVWEGLTRRGSGFMRELSGLSATPSSARGTNVRESTNVRDSYASSAAANTTTLNNNNTNTNTPQSSTTIEKKKEELKYTYTSLPCLLEILSTLPLEYLPILLPSIFPESATVYLLTNRILRITYLPSYLTQISVYLEERGLVKNVGLHRTWKLFFAMGLAGHWCGCLFFVVAVWKAEGGERVTWPESDLLFVSSTHYYSQLDLDSLDYDLNLSSQQQPSSSLLGQVKNTTLTYLASTNEVYIRSVYWAYITMITTGFGDIVPLTISETVTCIVSMYIGVVITTCAIANLQLVVTNMDAARTDFQLKMDALKMYMIYRRLPNSLQNRINSFYDYQWDLLRGADEEKFLIELPKSLQQQVTNYMSRDLLKTLTLLRKANNALLNALTDCVEANTYSPNDEILRVGENVKGVLLVSRGEVEILKDKNVERKLQRFDRFAEESLFIKTVSVNLVRSKTFCEIFLLPADEFQRVVNAQCDPSHINQMRETAEKQSKQASKANKMFGSAEDAVPLHGFRKHCVPGSDFRRMWGAVMFVAVIYYVFSIALSVMICVEVRDFWQYAANLIVGYLVDTLFVVDLIFESAFFMYLEEGLVVFDKERIRTNFLQNHSFTIELLSLLPWDLLAFLFGSRYSNILRLPKSLRIFKLFDYSDGVEKMLQDSRFGIDQAARRVFKLIFAMLIVCHWVGCTWYMFGTLSIVLYGDEIDGERGENTPTWRGTEVKVNWIEADNANQLFDVKHVDLGHLSGYLRSVYWAIVGLSTVGYGDIVPQNIIETVVATILILFGGLILPAIVGGLAAYMGNLNRALNQHKGKLYKVRTYMRRSHFPQLLMDKILRYYDYLWSRQGGVDEVEIMNELPGPLQQRVAMCVNGKALQGIPFFTMVDEGLQQYLVSMLNPHVFLPADLIINAGEVGKEMYIIERGSVIVSNEDKKISYAMLSEGDYFGETCLLGATTRMATVYAVGYCDCFVLSKDDFTEVMQAYLPKDRADIGNVVAKQVQGKIFKNLSVNKNFTTLPKCLQRTHVTKIDVKSEKINLHKARIKPEHHFKTFWNVVILIVCLYNAILVPYRLCFLSEVLDITTYIADWMLDFIFFIDVYLNLYEFSYIYQGSLITDSDEVKKHYKAGDYKLDVITMFPFDLFAFAFFFFGSSDEAERERNVVICLAVTRLPKLIRLSRLMSLNADITRALEETNISLTPIQMIKLLSGVMLIAHWAACGFHAFAFYRFSSDDCRALQNDPTVTTAQLMSNWENFRGSEYAQSFDSAGDVYTYCKWGRTWIQMQIEDGKLDAYAGTSLQRYLRGFNWALPTLVVVVIGDVIPISSPETLYAFMWMVFGVAINAFIVGNVANIVANLDTDSSVFVQKADDLKHYMHTHHVHQELQDRVQHFMTYLWTAHGGATNEGQFIEELPHTLQMAISDHTRLKYIKDCPFFDFCSNEIVKALAMCLTPLMFSVGDVLIQFNDMGQEMYFLEKGSVEVVSGDEKTVFATLSTGAFFGETALFFKQKRSATIRANEFCEVFQLDKRDLDNELRQREFDLSRMLDIFTFIADSNKSRNYSVANNLKASKTEGTKLYKMIDQNDATAMIAKRTRPMFLPNSNFRACWDISAMFFTIWFGISILYRIGFILDEQKDASYIYLLFDFIMDVFFLVDIYFRLFKFPIIQNGAIVTDRDKIWKNYRDTDLVLDVLASLPIELFVFIPSIGYGMVYQLRLIHMFRLYRLPVYFGKTDHYLNLWNIRISAATGLLCRMFSYYIFVNHWCACIWFIIHRYYERNLEFTWATTDCPEAGAIARGCLSVWDAEKMEHDICSSENGYTVFDCYIRAFYLVITTISTVGYGDIAPYTEIETIWENIVVLTGACIFAGIIGSFTAYLSQSDTSGPNAFKLKMQKLQEYMKYRKLPQELQGTILMHHKHRWNKSQILDERAVISILPRPLQLDLSFAVVQEVISSVPILSECSLIMQKRIAHSFTIQTAPPLSVIYEAGDIGWDIYFVGSGLIKVTLPKDLSVLDAAGRAANRMAKRKQVSIGNVYRIGNHFGESSLVSYSGVRQETSEARTMAELYLVTKEDLGVICSYMTAVDKDKFRDSLLARNGNVRHTFGVGDEDDDDGTGTGKTKNAPELKGTLKPSDPEGEGMHKAARHSRKSLEQALTAEQTGIFPNSASTTAPYQSKTNPNSSSRRKSAKVNTLKPPRDFVRLRSFSAEASAEALSPKNARAYNRGQSFVRANGSISEGGGGTSNGAADAANGGNGDMGDASTAAKNLQAMVASGAVVVKGLGLDGVIRDLEDCVDSDADSDSGAGYERSDSVTNLIKIDEDNGSADANGNGTHVAVRPRPAPKRSSFEMKGRRLQRKSLDQILVEPRIIDEMDEGISDALEALESEIIGSGRAPVFTKVSLKVM